ncbi:MAG: TonB-dependent receptor [Bacteroidota bacterium]|nr:TonB-dependent receptor [Bacteroidota bacterium]
MSDSGKSGIPTPTQKLRGVFHVPLLARTRTIPLMRFRSLLLLVPIPFWGIRLAAQNAEPADSLLYGFGREIVVTATRLPIPAARNPAATETFDADRIEGFAARSVGDILRASTAVHVLEYGAPGALQLASSRGLGAEYTVVCFDGVPINDAQNGLVDLSHFSLSSIRRVEIARGTFASLYGSDAIGSVIDIKSGGGPPLAIRLGIGSFGWNAYDLETHHETEMFRGRFTATQERARNDYVFHLPNSGRTQRRTNADMFRRGVAANTEFRFRRSVLSFFGRLHESTLGVPGAVTNPGVTPARQHDESFLFSAQYRRVLGAYTLLSIQPSLSLQRETYDDPSLLRDGIPLSADHENVSLRSLATILVDPVSFVRTIAGFEIGCAALRSTDVAGNPERISTAFFAAAEVTTRLPGNIRFFPSARFDRLVDRPSRKTMTELSPSLAAEAHVADEALSFYIRVGRGFRAPTFNHLYWRQGGSTALRPEQAVSFETGFHAALRGIGTTLGMTAYRHDVTDKIVWVPGKGMFWEPRNIRAVRSIGVEARASGSHVAGILHWTVQAAWTSARKMNASFEGDATQGKQLVSIPMHSGGVETHARLMDCLFLGITGRYIGARFAEETNDPASRMDPVFLVDAVVSVLQPFHQLDLTLRLEMLDVFDTPYEVIPFYPMPQRSFRLSLTTALREGTSR